MKHFFQILNFFQAHYSTHQAEKRKLKLERQTKEMGLQMRREKAGKLLKLIFAYSSTCSLFIGSWVC